MRINKGFSRVAIALGAGLASTVASSDPIDDIDDGAAMNVQLADLNGDGIDDVLLRRDGRWSYYPMGNLSTAPAQQGEVGVLGRPDALFAGFGDLDGDGWDDILLRDSDGNWLYNPMNGRESVATGQRGANITRNTDWNVAGLADFNGDGRDDVLLRHDHTGNWYYFPMQGDRHIRAARGMTDLPKDKAWRLAGLGDLNGDGNADVLLRHSGNGNWYYIPMDGQRTIVEQRGPARLPKGQAWSFAGIGDFDGDGMNEVLLRHRDGRWQRHSIVGRMALAGDPVAHLPADAEWQLAGIGDLNGDGSDDILLRHADGRWHSSGPADLRSLPATSPGPPPSGAQTQTGLLCNKVLLTLPGNPVIFPMHETYSIIDVDSDASAYEDLVTYGTVADVKLSWNKPRGHSGLYIVYLLNDQVVRKHTVGTVPGTSSYQEGEATLQISNGGQYDLQIGLCGWHDVKFLRESSCCSYSNVRSFAVVDTDGAHVDPITLNAGENNTPYKNSTDSVVGAYFVEWGIYGRNFTVDKIPAYNLTHILYGFIPICGGDTINDSLKTIKGSFEALQKSCKDRDDFKVAIHDPWAAVQKPQAGQEWSTPYKGNFGQFMELKKAYPDLKILPSIGGWTLSDPFFYMHDATKRTTFVDSVKEFLLVWKFFDGVDIDWEFPGGGAANPSLGNPAVDGTTYKLLMRELQAMLDQLELDTGRSLELTSAIAAGDDKIGRVNYKDAQQYMDHIFVMTYDFYGAWSTTVLGHQAALYAPSWKPKDTYNAHGGIQALLKQGVSSSKLVLGVAMYGRGWSGVSHWTGVHHLTGRATGPVTPGSWEAGVVDYRDIVKKRASTDWSYFWDATAQAPYIFGNTATVIDDTTTASSTTYTAGDLITYDDPTSVQAKGAYALTHNLGGLFAWEIDADNGDILNAMHLGLGHGAGSTNRAPVARAGVNQNVAIGATVTLDASTSYDLDGDTLTYSWAKTSGPAVTFDSTTLASITTFTAPTVTVRTDLVFAVTVSDGTLSSTDSLIVAVAPNAPPTANAGPDQSFATPYSIQLKGSGSDEDGDALTYSWTQESGTTVTLADSSSALTSFTAPAVSAQTTLRFELTVTDTRQATATDQVDITLTVGSTAACQTTDPNAGNHTAWSATQSHYVGTDRVSHKGLVWEAKYWTDTEPAITATTWPADWTLITTNVEIPWNPQAVYVKDDEVNHKTRRYRAGWWNQGEEPPGTTGVWTDIGANTCP